MTTHNPRLQRGLVPADKAERVAWYARNMERELFIIAHSCGVPRPRLLRRHHARVVNGAGRSILMSKMWPEVPVRPEFRRAAPAGQSAG